MKSNDPQTQPWMTRHEVGSISGEPFPILIACCLPVGYEENQHNAKLHMSCKVGKRLMSVSWPMESRVSVITAIISVNANVITYFYKSSFCGVNLFVRRLQHIG